MNRALSSLHGGSLEFTLTVLLSLENLPHNISMKKIGHK